VIFSGCSESPEGEERFLLFFSGAFLAADDVGDGGASAPCDDSVCIAMAVIVSGFEKSELCGCQTADRQSCYVVCQSVFEIKSRGMNDQCFCLNMIGYGGTRGDGYRSYESLKNSG
jgi:hypothetical protein